MNLGIRVQLFTLLCVAALHGVMCGQSDSGAALLNQPHRVRIRGGLSFMIAGDEYSPMLVMRLPLDHVDAEHTMNFTVLGHNPYNSNKVGFSYMGLIDLGLTLAGSLVHSDDTPGLRNFIAYAIILPVFALNSRAYVKLAGPGEWLPVERLHVAICGGMRTDLYGDNITWLRWNPGCGVQVGWSVADGEKAGILAAHAGLEKTFDIGTGSPSVGHSRLAAGLSYYFPQ